MIVFIPFCVKRANSQGLLNNTAVHAIHFDPRYPHHFIAAFADSTILLFNLFAEDPVPMAINHNPMPWTTVFERAEETAQTKGDGTKESEEKLLVWKNEEFGNLGDIKKGAKEERPTWAGRNPMGAYKLPTKNINGELEGAQGTIPVLALTTAMSYSPDASQLAVVAEDGRLRLIDVAEEK